MVNLTYNDVDGSDMVIYKYIRGSHAYGLEKPDGTSDIDTALVYLEPINQVMGLGLDYQEQVADERNDNVAYGLRKFMNLLLTSNPTALESLFIPERCVLYEHPIMTEIKKHREKFITKSCFKPFLGYSYEQIRKCRGLNKRFLQEKLERKTPMDFCYTFFRQGSTKFENWLEHRAMKQEYCGLVNIPNMGDVIGVYYDWGRFFREENITIDRLLNCWEMFSCNDEDGQTVEIMRDLKALEESSIRNADYEKRHKGLEELIYDTQLANLCQFIINRYKLDDNRESVTSWYEEQKPIGYKGVIGQNSNEVRLSSVSKGEKPICYITYNSNAYQQHCVDYKNQCEWEAKRNPERYKENKGKMFDRKNVAHAVRLLHMGLEIAKTGKFNVDRTNIDRDFILNIRLGNTSYEEIIEYIEKKKEEMEEAMKFSTLPETIDVEFVNNLLLDIRRLQIEDDKQ